MTIWVVERNGSAVARFDTKGDAERWLAAQPRREECEVYRLPQHASIDPALRGRCEVVVTHEKREPAHGGRRRVSERNRYRVTRLEPLDLTLQNQGPGYADWRDPEAAERWAHDYVSTGHYGLVELWDRQIGSVTIFRPGHRRR